MCYEAYDALLSTHMLAEADERELTQSLELAPEAGWIREVYTVMGSSREVESPLIRESNGAGDDEIMDEVGASSMSGTMRAESKEYSDVIDALRSNGDVRVACARRMYQRGEFAACYAELHRQFELDPSRLNGMPLYFATLVELGKKNDLYLIAHSLVADYPDKAMTWFAIGCYYMVTRQYDSARKYFSKATKINPSFVQAWIGYGHAFAAQDESDQAMAAYRTATRLFAGTHIPVLAIGMEYQRTNNLSLAQQFFSKAAEICDTDPLLHNELGVALYRQGDYANAVACFQRALSLVPVPVAMRWESLIVNLAHSLRKLGRYNDAIEHFEMALTIAPRVASTHTAIAFTYQLKSRCTEPVSLGLAVEYYHKALGLRADDSFAQHHLELALIDQSAITMPRHKKVEYNTTFPMYDTTNASPSPLRAASGGGLFPDVSPQSFQSTPTFGGPASAQTPRTAAIDESVDMDQSVDME
jgi:anaphase-promoting complex subunit 6